MIMVTSTTCHTQCSAIITLHTVTDVYCHCMAAAETWNLLAALVRNTHYKDAGDCEYWSTQHFDTTGEDYQNKVFTTAILNDMSLHGSRHGKSISDCE